MHVECPSCLFEFAKTGDKLWGLGFCGNGSGRAGDESGRVVAPRYGLQV